MPTRASFVDLLARRLRGEDGQTMTEYAVVIGVITVAVVGAIAALSAGVVTVVEAIANVI